MAGGPDLTTPGHTGGSRQPREFGRWRSPCARCGRTFDAGRLARRASTWFIIGLGTRLLQALIGPFAIFISLAIFVFLNIASLGATYTSPVLPRFWRFVNHFWIGAQAVNAQRSILYFGGQGVATDMLRLLAWAGVIAALLVLPVSRKLERQREHAVDAVAVPPAGAAA